jgi:hypothetical protein
MKMKIEHELNALQNHADYLNVQMCIGQAFCQDKRKTVGKYFAIINGMSVSPVLPYNELNHFLLGWGEAMKHRNQ